MVMRGVSRADARASRSSPRPATQVRHARGAPRSPSTRLLPRSSFPRRAGPALRVAGGALEHLGNARRL